MRAQELNTAFATISGYEGLYSISFTGIVWSHKKKCGVSSHEGKELKPHQDGSGYLFVMLSKDGVRKQPKLHRLIAENFIPNPHNYQVVNHKNGIKTDNRIENLEWCTQSDNIKHSFKMGLSSQLGSRNAQSKLTETDVISIRLKYSAGISRKILANDFKISLATLCDIINNKIWKHV